MPTICTFYGMQIQMSFRDHVPAHFHVTYDDFKATIDINKVMLLGGSLPRRALNLALDWTELHQAELLENWRLCAARQEPAAIAPLE